MGEIHDAHPEEYKLIICMHGIKRDKIELQCVFKWCVPMSMIGFICFIKYTHFFSRIYPQWNKRNHIEMMMICTIKTK